MAQKQLIPNVPLRTPMFDAQGNLTRTWVEFFQGVGNRISTAPNAVAATADPTFRLHGHDTEFTFTGTIAFTASSVIANLGRLVITAIDADGTRTKIGEFVDFTVLPLEYTGTAWFPLTTSDQDWTVEFQPYDQAGNPTEQPLTVDVTVYAGAVGAVTGVDASTLDPANPDFHPRWQAKDLTLRLVVNAAVTLAHDEYPQIVTLWVDYQDGTGDHWQGWWSATDASTVIPIGLDGSNTALFQPDTAQEWIVRAAPGAVLQEDGVPAGAVASAPFAVGVPAVGTVSAVDASTLDHADPDYHKRWKDDPGAVHTVINVNVALQASWEYPAVVTIWLNQGSAGLRWHGWFSLGAAGVIPLGLKNSTTEVYPPIVESELWYAIVAAGRIDKNVDPATVAGAVTSATFTEPVMAPPLATLITELTVGAPGSGAFPYDCLRPDGSHYFGIPGIGYDDTGCLDDPDAYFVRITAQDYGASGTPVGPEQPFAGTLVSKAGQVQTFDALLGDYGTAGGGYTRTGDIASVRLRAYVCNSSDGSSASFENPVAATLQTGVGSGAGYVDVPVVTGGAVTGSRIVTTSGSMLLTDAGGTVLVDTETVTPPSSAALNGAMTAVQVNVALRSSPATVNGQLVQVDSERMLITAGGGTNNLVVERGADGTTAATHLDNATVQLGGTLTFTLLPIASIPGSTLVIRHATYDIHLVDDLNSVTVAAGSGNSFPGGSPVLVLAGKATSNGMTCLVFPAGSSVVLPTSGVGSGSVGPPGASGSTATPAPDILSATAEAVYSQWAHESTFGFHVTITLDTLNANYSHDRSISAVAYGPGVGVAGMEIGRFLEPFTDPVDWTAGEFHQPVSGGLQAWTIAFILLNENGEPTVSAHPASVNVSPAGVASVSAVDASTLDPSNPDYQLRWKDDGGALHTVINVTVSLSNAQYPQTVSIFLDKGDGAGPRLQAWRTATEDGQVFQLGLQGDDIIVYPPTIADGSWTAVVAVGAHNDGDIPAEAVTSAPFTVPAPAAPGARDATNAWIDELVINTPAQLWGWKNLFVTLPFDHPNFKGARWTVQNGHYDGSGNFVAGDPVTAQHGGQEVRWTDLDGVSVLRLPGTNTVTVQNNDPASLWTIPDYKLADGTVNPDNVFRIRNLVASSRAVSESDDATWTQQQDWSATVGDSTPGTADHLDIVFDLSTGMLNILNVNPAAIGNGLQLSGTQLLAKVSSGIQFDGSGNIVVKNGSGIAIDYSGRVTVNQGVGLQIDGSGFLTVKPSTGLAANSSGVYIPGGAITNSLLAALAVAQANIQSSAVGTAQIATASITAALCQYAFITNALLGFAVVGTANIQNAAITNALIGALAVGTAQIQDLAVTNAKISSLDVTKLNAGTISVAVSLTAPTITVTSGTATINIDGTHWIKLTDTATQTTAYLAPGAVALGHNLTQAMAALGLASWSGQYHGGLTLQEQGGYPTVVTSYLGGAPAVPPVPAPPEYLMCIRYLPTPPYIVAAYLPLYR